MNPALLLVSVLAAVHALRSPFAGVLGRIAQLRLYQMGADDKTAWTDYSEAAGDLVRVYEMPEGWVNCGCEKDLFRLDLMAVSPDPPRRSENATVRVVGELREDITGNVKVDYVVKYGSLPIVRDTVDACELLGEYAVLPQCPLKRGRYDVTYSELLPGYTPMGTYTVHAEGYMPQPDGSKRPVFCVEGVVVIRLFNPATKAVYSAQR